MESTPVRNGDGNGEGDGLHVSRVPSKPVQREADGRLAIHLWLRKGGTFDGDLALRLSPAEAELLHAQLCFALAEEPAAPTTSSGAVPGCRQPVQGPSGVRW
ncbi:hypothetical protein [Streptomyces daliensis]|uniref:Uncharacterized protein n=1 Tax=Streptomyces daliensis TaxID=299421 RepID=A0A8T4J2P2_9ACTN|nr:hypothetical protein [Streptomyces daliensis]